MNEDDTALDASPRPGFPLALYFVIAVWIACTFAMWTLVIIGIAAAFGFPSLWNSVVLGALAASLCTWGTITLMLGTAPNMNTHFVAAVVMTILTAALFSPFCLLLMLVAFVTFKSEPRYCAWHKHYWSEDTV